MTTNQEEKRIDYKFLVKSDLNDFLNQVAYDIGEENVIKIEDDYVTVLFYELDPDNGDNQSVYIAEWFTKFDLKLIATYY